ncbi:MAG: hypothetical protein JXN65_08385 [Clostridia bacterium]|nr:hypothetical protein [Clostridia bacterium]
MKGLNFIKIVYFLVAVLFVFSVPALAADDGYDKEYPQENAWYQATPSVVWLNDPESTTTIEVHIEGRNDVSRVWMTDLGSDEAEGRRELFDDGTNGDKIPGDNIYTLADVVIPCHTRSETYYTWWGFIRVELKDGTMMGNNYGLAIGQVNPVNKEAFKVQDFGDGVTATTYAVFVEDPDYQIFEGYPVSDFYCGMEMPYASQQIYQFFPDEFDFITVMPGMQCFRTGDLAENVPYHLPVSNYVENIGMPMIDHTEEYGSAGRLRSFVYHSFGSIAIMDHEMGHSWAAYIGQDMGILKDEWSPHWNSMVDTQGQMGAYYFDDESVGHFAYNGDETWSLVSNYTVEPYSPIELYFMGLIPSSEVPDIHILKNPDLLDTDNITAESYKTITMEQILESEGGERIPSYLESQKEFNMAFIVAQDLPFNDAAYAYFSLISMELMSKEEPEQYSSQAPFYWATGGRATLNTYLGDYGVLDESLTATPTAEPLETPAAETPEINEETAAIEQEAQATPEAGDIEEAAAEDEETDSFPLKSLILFGGIILVAVIIVAVLISIGVNRKQSNE